ncbi:MAG: AmmeMemoRadiSam system protein B [Ignavibacteriae bacterium]|nr:AmmeMemoRadiSam system protein B [Ignavibacteriota bacterium]MCB9207189.1 AmmeMemoRadiSam system protein B [Ignavibacteriales bacterium]MCB9210324.1 AmmeMemoRadiSam system protein B [Ignavibacteriales bacterium]MCB9219129.1 AmmeMemoRadiSam system protein B [Ignavibacteriales bacterium]MCB9259711.1 AmmeMemoRadiSam system protein B [Ignavibacteriales bacterium]
MKKIREAHVAGMFYPSDPKVLKKQINDFFDLVKIDINYKNVAGIISPHAGYMYSGKTAAHGFKTIQNKKYKTVIVISPSHREYFHGISIYDGDAYKTPLGEIPIDKAMKTEIISKSDLIFEGIEGHRVEHALEVQLPFLQMSLSNFELVPIVIGDQRKQYVNELGEVLSHFINDNTLLVASTDLSHFYTKSQANILDSRVAEHINKFQFEELQNDLEGKRCEACGGGGIVALMKALKMNNYNSSSVVAKSDSGDITGDESEVVGYLSAVIYN